MVHAVQSSSNYGKRRKEERSLDKLIQDEPLEKLIGILRSFGKSDAEIKESLVQDLALSRQRLELFLNSEGLPDSSGH